MELGDNTCDWKVEVSEQGFDAHKMTSLLDKVSGRDKGPNITFISKSLGSSSL